MLNFENFNKEKRTIDLVKANVIGLLFLVGFTLLLGLPFYLIWGFELPKLEIDHLKYLAILPLIILISGIIIHELIHGVFFAFFAKNGFRSIKFGILWKMLTPYCHCKEPLKIKQYTIALLAPLVILGILPAIYAISVGNIFILILGIFFSGAAAGDLLIYNLIRKENPEDYVLDHPSEAGFYLYTKK
ncbi:DUF3267 domain-containing protein [Kaistella yonginensis]|uniref:DUF3267 domain-containing protein n=1 Tax=Kaistella yonginensis TaxID=658267 RepID=UPI0025B48A3C|nr:DUF3267 domain-containing protein [Kaistella yonginensis]MDN3608039.1 DUF3267 domain-containing protein [Kaistella yonginensis]